MRATAEQRSADALRALRSPAAVDVYLTLAATLAGALVAWFAIELAGDYVTFRRDRVLIVLAGFAVTVLALPDRRVPWGAAALALTWIVGWIAFTTIPDGIFIDTPVDQAAGGAAYYGTPYVPQQLAAAVLGVAVVAVAVAAAVLMSRTPREPEPDAPAEAVGRGRGAVAAAVGVALVALTALPDLASTALNDPLGPYKANTTLATWDVSNVMTWHWLIDEGAVPMGDFFWPYGQTWVFNVFPLGPLWAWVANCGILALLSWALWRLSPPEGRAARVVLCALALVMLGLWQGAIWRYSVPLVLALVYAAVGPASHRRPTWGHAVLALAALNAALWGFDSLGYGIGGMALVLLGELLSGRLALRPLGGLVRGLAVDAAAMLAVLLVPLLWVLQGSFEGNARFAFGVRGVSATGAGAQNVLGALKEYIGFKPTYEMVSVVAPGVLVAAGLAHSLLGGRRGAVLARVLLAAGGVMFVVVLKHLVRPQGEIMFGVPILALLLCGILAWQVRRWLLAAAVGALIATFVWTLEQSSVVDNYWASAKRTPARVIDDIELTGKTDQIAAIDRRTFQPQNLPRWDLELSLVRQLRAEMRRQSDDSFAVLGDLPYLYVYFDERPPFHVELYDASKRGEQEAMVEELEDEDPNLILWRRDFGQDGVPQAVRVPIVMQWVAERYVPVREGPISDVLRRRRPGEPARPEWWHQRLGEPFSVGYVAAASDGEEAEDCDVGSDGCNAYVVVEGEPASRDQQIGVTISGRGRDFGVILLGRPGVDEYAVRLDRLWFAPFLGPEPTVASGVPGFEARLEGHRSGDDLW